MTFFYFAYGSNMLTARLRARCPTAVPVARAEVNGFRVVFTKRGRDQSAKATLHQAAEGAHGSPGVVFEIGKADLGNLDRAEGLGAGYERNDGVAVRLGDGGEIVHAATYFATHTDESLKPFDWYLALVIAGAHEHDLGDDHIARLRDIPFHADTDVNRAARQEAMKALDAAGLGDYRRLLSPLGN